MTTNAEQIVYKAVEDLIPYEKNPRINKDAVAGVAESIKNFGFKQPIVIDGDNVIIAGHTRLKAAKKLHLRHVPCIVADDLTEEQAKALRLADNKVAEAAEWDFDLLADELGDIVDIDMELFGFLADDDLNDEPAEPKEEKDLSDTLAETYEVIIECDSELQQEEIYYRLTQEGLTCRVLTL